MTTPIACGRTWTAPHIHRCNLNPCEGIHQCGTCGETVEFDVDEYRAETLKRLARSVGKRRQEGSGR